MDAHGTLKVFVTWSGLHVCEGIELNVRTGDKDYLAKVRWSMWEQTAFEPSKIVAQLSLVPKFLEATYILPVHWAEMTQRVGHILSTLVFPSLNTGADGSFTDALTADVTKRRRPLSMSTYYMIYSTTGKGSASQTSPDWSPPHALSPATPSSSNQNDTMQKNEERERNMKEAKMELKAQERREGKGIKLENKCDHWNL